MLEGRKRINVAAACGVLALTGSLLVSSPSHAEPDLEEAGTEASGCTTRPRWPPSATTTPASPRGERGRLTSLHADVARQEAKVEAVREQVASAVVAQYQGQTLSTATQVLLSEDADQFIEKVTTVSAFNDQQASS